MELIEVEMVRAEAAEGLLELLPRAGGVAAGGLAGQERVFPVRLESRAKFDFRLAVSIRGRDVEVVHAAVPGGCHEAVGFVLVVAHHDDAAKADDGQLDAVAVGAAGKRRGAAGEGRGGGSGDKGASIHGFYYSGPGGGCKGCSRVICVREGIHGSKKSVRFSAGVAGSV